MRNHSRCELLSISGSEIAFVLIFSQKQDSKEILDKKVIETVKFIRSALQTHIAKIRQLEWNVSASSYSLGNSIIATGTVSGLIKVDFKIQAHSWKQGSAYIYTLISAKFPTKSWLSPC